MKDLEAEFERFVRVRAPSLLRMAVLLAGDVDQAEDLLQQTLWRVYSRWADASAHPDAYARVVLANLNHDRHRGSRRRPTTTIVDLDARAAEHDDIGTFLERDSIMRALQRLPDRQRTTLVLRFWEELSVQETAEVMGCALGTVKSNTSHGLNALRGFLRETTGESSPGGRRNVT